MFMMRTLIFLSLFFLLGTLLFRCEAVVNLRPGGRNVRRTTVSYYVTETTSVKVRKSRRTCTQTCDTRVLWCWSYKTVCKTVYYTTYEPKTVLRLKYRIEYVCSDGWQRRSSRDDECLKPICTGGCQNGGTCVSPNNCRCRSGWTGNRCGDDVNECYRNDDCCYSPATCSNTQGSYYCSCPTGFTTSGTCRCTDIDECSRGTYSCGRNTRCYDTYGSYKCECLSGYTRSSYSSKSCIDINECNGYHGCEGSCINTDGSYRCTCPTGYDLVDGKRCVDQVECAGDGHGCEGFCENFPGGYRCGCHKGFVLDKGDKKSCDDVDECVKGISGCAQTCTNTQGSFTCSCNTGYELETADMKSCTDIDECATGVHVCQHNCTNFPGGYRCFCRAGFDLKDGTKCSGRPCFPIFSPFNGAKECSGYTTDKVCHFRCSKGYELQSGSRKRTCMASKRWSGEQTKCKIIHCPTAEDPENGFVYRPCNTHYRSQCLVGCTEGYYIAGYNNVTCNSLGAWQPAITCKKIQVCQPNPCLHGGICTVVSSTSYSCDCSQTKYEGINCQTGIITTPPYPKLTPNIPSHPLPYHASPPSKYITLTLLNNNLHFYPTQLTFKDGSPLTQYISITAHTPGRYLISYSLSGPNAQEFQVPEQDIIFVGSSTSLTEPPEETIAKGFPRGCHKRKLNKCPEHNDVISLSSTSPWVTYGSLAITNGVVSLETVSNSLPLSLVGANLLNNDDTGTLEACDKKNDNFSSESLNKLHMLDRSFVNSVQQSFPKWLNVSLRNDTSTAKVSASLKTYYMTGKDLRKTEIGKGQIIPNDEPFSILMSRVLNVTIENDSVNNLLESRDRNPVFSLSVSLCGPAPRNILLSPSAKDIDSVNNIEVIRRLRESGWNAKVASIQISPTKSIKKFATGPFWDGKDWTTINSSPNGNLAMVMSLKKSFGNDAYVRSGVDFDGTVVADVENIDKIFDVPNEQEWQADLYGKMKITAEFKMENRTSQINVKAPWSMSYARFGGKVERRVDSSIDSRPEGLFFSSQVDEDPFLNSGLKNFVSLGQNRSFSYFINNDTNSAINMAFSGQMKYGSLRFPHTSVQVSLPNNKISQAHNPVDGDPHDSRTNMAAEISGNTEKQPGDQKFGIFKNSADVPLNVHLKIPREGNTGATGSFQAISNILGIEKLVNVNISQTGLNFATSGKVWGLYDASMECSASLGPWENHVFTARGVFDNPLDKNRLRKDLIVKMNGEARSIIEEVEKRLSGSGKAVQRTQVRLEKIKKAERNATERETRFRAEYLDIVAKLRAAEEKLSTIKSAAIAHTDDINELKAKLDDLCKLQQCFDICQEGMACSTCSEDVIGKAMGMCPGTCYTTTQHRLPPYNERALCETEKCKRIHSTNGLFKRLFGVFGTIIKKGFSFLVTAVTTVLGVPPQYARVIGQGVTTFLDTGSIKQTLCVVGKGLLTGFIGGDVIDDLVDGLGKVSIKGKIAEGVRGAIDKGVRSVSCQREQRDGSWRCGVNVVVCSKGLYNYKYEHTPYTCQRSCEKYKIVKTMKKSCCDWQPCAFVVQNITCLAENSLCDKARRENWDILSVEKAEAAKVLRKLENAKGNVSLLKMQKQKGSFKLQAASKLRHKLRDAIGEFEKAYNATIENQKRVNEVFSMPLQLRRLLDKDMKAVVKIKLGTIKFKTQVSAKEKTMLLPIDIAFTVNSTQELMSTVLDFGHLNSSLRSIAREILGRAIGDMSVVSRRKRRSVPEDDDEHTTTFQQRKHYHRMCSQVMNYEQILSDVVGTLNNLTSEAQRQKEIAGSIDGASSLNVSEILERSKLNGSAILSNESYSEFLETDPLILEATSMQQEANAESLEQVQTANDLVVSQWVATMEDFFNDSTIAEECSGLDDCLTFIMDSLSEMFGEVDNSIETQVVLEKIQDVRKQLMTLTRDTEVSLNQAMGISSGILKVLQELRNVEVFCGRPPNITQYPEGFTETGLGQTIRLSCYATGTRVVYQWTMNEEILEKQTSDVLLIQNASASDSGNYTCIVSNYIDTEKSSIAVVIIHRPPVITTQPDNHLDVVLSRDSFLYCGAESTAQNISYKWWFKPVGTNVTSFSLLKNEIFSVLNFIGMRIDQEGWHYCNVSTSFGYTVSKRSYVKALRFSLPVPTAKILLTVYHDNSTSDKASLSNIEDVSIHLFDFLSSKVNLQTTRLQAPESMMQPIKNLRPATCELRTTDGRNVNGSSRGEVVDACVWQFRYVGENVTSNSTVTEGPELNSEKLGNATLDLQQAVGELVNATNNGSSFPGNNNQTYLVADNSVGVENIYFMCPIGQAFVPEKYICVECSPGNYGSVDEDSNAMCEPCPLGSYQTEAGRLACVNCSRGFTTTSLGSYRKEDCEDIDECSASLYDCQQNCINIPGGYECSCRAGFVLEDGIKCSDVNECQSEGISGCAHTCTNTHGSFVCSCNTGYELETDTKSCTEVARPTAKPSNKKVTDDDLPNQSGEHAGGGGDGPGLPVIIGGGVGGVVVLLVFIGVVIWVCRRKKDKPTVQSSFAHENPAFVVDHGAAEGNIYEEAPGTSSQFYPRSYGELFDERVDLPQDLKYESYPQKGSNDEPPAYETVHLPQDLKYGNYPQKRSNDEPPAYETWE